MRETAERLAYQVPGTAQDWRIRPLVQRLTFTSQLTKLADDQLATIQ